MYMETAALQKETDKRLGKLGSRFGDMVEPEGMYSLREW